MNSPDYDFFIRSYSLEYTKRYSMKPTIHQESVATHCFFVALGVIMLSKTYEFDLGVAVKLAICHDLAEMEISDVNHYVKKQHPDVAQALKDAEYRIIESFPEQVKEYCRQYGDHSPEALVVHYADALQCSQYATSEINLGNSGYMLEVYRNSQARMKQMEEKLEPYRKKDANN